VAYDRILTLGLNDVPVWIRLYLGRTGSRWVGMLLPDDAPAPQAGTLNGIAVFGTTSEEARALALRYLSVTGILNCPRCGSLQAVATESRRRPPALPSVSSASRGFVCRECGESWTSQHHP
jgi:hypothetical protein